jgi:hypothetical protein
MAGYEIYPFFPGRDQRLKPFPASSAYELKDPCPEDPPEGDPFTLLYKLIDGKMEMVLVRQNGTGEEQ